MREFKATINTPPFLPTLIFLCLVSSSAYTQQSTAEPGSLDCKDTSGTPPGLYVTVDQSQVYLDKDDQRVELKPGEAAYAGENSMQCLKTVPAFLDWPCGTANAGQIVKFPSYTLEQLGPDKSIQAIINRYFDLPEIIDPPLEWLNGVFHSKFSAGELSQYGTPEYWYLPSGTAPFSSGKRPETALISLYWSTRQVVLDNYSFNELKKMLGDQPIPVVFVFQGENIVPVSYLGKDVTLDLISQAYFRSGMELAEVPVWYAGDHHLLTRIEEFERLFDIPELDDIDAGRLVAMTADLKANGFSKKPIIVSIMGESTSLVVDQPERIRAAASIGMDTIPTVVFYYGRDSHMKRCGLALPQVDSGSGIGSFSAPPAVELLVPRPKPERPASRS